MSAKNPAATGVREHLNLLCSYGGWPITVMEVCGTHTMAIARAGLKALLPESIRLISGPGCPVCVTPVGYIDRALAIAREDDVIIATFGDLMRVPGSRLDVSDAAPNLTRARAQGADVRVVYSPLGALDLARSNPKKRIVFLGVGFETTAPVIGAALLTASRERLTNFSVLSALKTIPAALAMLAAAREPRIDGFLCPGHVSVVLGSAVYRELVDRYEMPCAVAGFEPVEITRGLVALVEQIRADTPRVDNCYPGAVRADGNRKAKAVMETAFRTTDSAWRGLGVIPWSGLAPKPALEMHDAYKCFDVALSPAREPAGCRCGDVLRGTLEPDECALFGTVCTPEEPQGACMVSSEGSCAASYHYRKGD